MAAGNVVKGVLCLAAAGALWHFAHSQPSSGAGQPAVVYDAPVVRTADTGGVAMPASEAADPATQMPAIERTFIGLIANYADAFRAAENDMAKGATRPARAKAVCAAFRATNQHNVPWVGTVKDLSSSGSGKGVLVLEIADGVTVGTTNNEISDALGMKTLIEPGNQIYDTAMHLHVGQAVMFRGKFDRSTTDCFRVEDLTQQGAMTEPEYLMAFSSLSPVR